MHAPASASTHKRSPYSTAKQYQSSKSGSKSHRNREASVDNTSTSLPVVQIFPTNFSKILRDGPPPVPPALLRLPTVPLTRKDPTSRVSKRLYNDFVSFCPILVYFVLFSRILRLIVFITVNFCIHDSMQMKIYFSLSFPPPH